MPTTTSTRHCMSCGNAFDNEPGEFAGGYFQHRCDETAATCNCRYYYCQAHKPRPAHTCGTYEWDRGSVYLTTSQSGRRVWRCTRCAFQTAA